jgi:hypothetical protein
MAKRKSIKREVSEFKAKTTRKIKREWFDKACKKSRVENGDDVCGVFMGLSRKAIELAAYDKIFRLARLGCSPLEIVKRMEGKQCE